MALGRKIAGSTLLLLAVGAVGLAYAISFNRACLAPSQAAATGEPGSMRAAIHRCYGAPEVLELVSLPRPQPAENEVLVKVHAAGVNPLDWHYMRGSPYVMRLMSGIGRPSQERLGVDFAGTVEAVGSGVTRFKPGDAVFGGRSGAFAEYLTIGEHKAIALKPPNVGFEEAATVPIAAVTALQAVRDKGRVTAGQKVLVNGASGGVGTFAVQIARHLGAEVTGVSSARNHAMVRALGAGHMIDYRQQDYTESTERYDVIIDNVGNHSLLANHRALKNGGILVMVGAPKGDWFAPLKNVVLAPLLSPFVSTEFATLLAQLNAGDLDYLAGLMAQGDITPVIDREFTLEAVADAMRYSESGRARGKIVISVRAAAEK